MWAAKQHCLFHSLRSNHNVGGCTSQPTEQNVTSERKGGQARVMPHARQRSTREAVRRSELVTSEHPRQGGVENWENPLATRRCRHKHTGELHGLQARTPSTAGQRASRIQKSRPNTINLRTQANKRREAARADHPAAPPNFNFWSAVTKM